MPAPDAVERLVEEFRANEERYTQPSYKEYSVRSEFINPLFEALGWPVTSTQGVAPEAREVVFEDTIHKDDAPEDAIERIVGKIPDYSFRIDGKRKFYVEAKKPYENLETNRAHAFQVRAYGWSARLPISILTDFQQFSVYDCRIRPEHRDRADFALLPGFRLTYEQYVDRWDDIAALLSREAVAGGSVDRLAEKRPPGTLTVDAAFLKEISEWREILAQDLATRNPGLSQRDLNYAVQMTINRIIFLRIAEDRGIEPDEQLKLTLRHAGKMYPHLVDLFTRAHERYNSGLFHFKQERAITEQPDEFTLSLKVGDEPITRIIEQLYYPSPYKFDVIPIEILGQVYEQFLGKVIRITDDGPQTIDDGPQTTDDVANNTQIQNPKSKIQNVVIEDKPEVRKAGGVYYTPTYIVDYIVEQTVGKLLDGKTPKEAAALRILDPACGSGSFLIGAYSYLLDWHLRWYTANDPAELARTGRGRTPVLVPVTNTGGGAPGWKLSLRERKKILQNNIYGVDIDAQAVEVTKLSLLLKVLEGETSASLGVQLGLAGVATAERVLPDLGDNIKSGNSLIGPDFYTSAQASFLDREEQNRINAFDWQREFARVMKAGGFDAVIGNPPYGAWFQASEAAYFGKRYETFRGVKDVYTFFIEKGISLLRSEGHLSYIVPSAWIGGPDYVRLRDLLLQHTIIKIVLLPFDVFADAYVDTAIVVLSAQPVQAQHRTQTYVFQKRARLHHIELGPEQYNLISQLDWQLTEGTKFVLEPATMSLLQKLTVTAPRTVADVATMKRGVLFEKSLLTNSQVNEQSHLYFEGDVYRYNINVVTENWVEFGDKMKERPREFSWFEGERLLLRRLVNRRQRLMASLARDTFITNKNLYSVKVSDPNIDAQVLLGILNSRLLSFLYINQVTQASKDDFPQVTIKDILGLPFPPSGVLDKDRVRMGSLVERMLTLHKDLPGAKSPYDKQTIERQIEATDAAIDRLVYDLYGLTSEEIGVVEGR